MVQPKDLVFTTDSSPTSENQVVILFVREDTIIQKQVILKAASDCDTFVWAEREAPWHAFGGQNSDNNQQRKNLLDTLKIQ